MPRHSTEADLAVLRGSELFDPSWYLAQNPDALASGLDPALHYLRVGSRLGRNPGPGFDAADYARAHGLPLGACALLHHLRAAAPHAPPAPAETPRPPPPSPGRIYAQRIRYLLPVGGGGGGAHSVVQDCHAMRAMGVDAAILVWQHQHDAYLRLYADLDGAAALFQPFTALDQLPDRLGGVDVAVATLYSCLEMLAPTLARHPSLTLAYYIQDYEPWFFAEGDPERAKALASYTAHQPMLRFAKTTWLCRTVAERHAVSVEKITPALDHRLFHPAPDWGREAGALRITAMIRPSTPRRGADRTAALLHRLDRALGPRLRLQTFGADPAEPDLQRLLQDVPVQAHGVLTRPEVADLMRQTDIFVDMSDYQAFGRSAAEAMASGAAVLVPQTGGTQEFAEHEVTALVQDTQDIDACAAALIALVNNPARLWALRLAGLRRVQGFTPRASALDQLVLMAQTRLARGT